MARSLFFQPFVCDEVSTLLLLYCRHRQERIQEVSLKNFSSAVGYRGSSSRSTLFRKATDMRRNSHLIIAALIVAVAAVLLWSPIQPSRGASSAKIDLTKYGAPNVDVNASVGAVRKATSAQLSAIDQFKSNYGNQATLRWNSFAGSPDVMMGFHTGASSDTPENVARTFIATNTTLFGVDPTALKLVDQKEGLGGYLVKFQQNVGGADVVNGGVGFVMTANKEIRMVTGSTFRDVNVASAP